MERITYFIHTFHSGISQLRTDTKQEITNQQQRQGELRRGHVLTLQGACTFSLVSRYLMHLRRSLECCSQRKHEGTLYTEWQLFPGWETLPSKDGVPAVTRSLPSEELGREEEAEPHHS